MEKKGRTGLTLVNTTLLEEFHRLDSQGALDELIEKDDEDKDLDYMGEKVSAKTSEPIIDDPLEELLNEFRELEEEDEDDVLKDQRDKGNYFKNSLHEVEELINRDYSHLDYESEIHDKLHALHEILQRIEFYSHEVETHLPG